MTGAMIERMTAWQCVGCGRIEDTQPCIGVCRDRKVNFVYAEEYDRLQAELARLSSRAAALGAVVREIAHMTPREGQWERTYRVLQARARCALEACNAGGQSRPAEFSSPGAAGRKKCV
jgi:hypothetical protein